MVLGLSLIHIYFVGVDPLRIVVLVVELVFVDIVGLSSIILPFDVGHIGQDVYKRQVPDQILAPNPEFFRQPPPAR